MKPIVSKPPCYHCGDPCPDDRFSIDGNTFCCQGCQTVWKILADNNLANYYQFDSHPGTKTTRQPTDYTYLDQPEIKERLITFSTDYTSTVYLHLPQIHCSACIWLLEHLHKIDPAVIQSRVNFLKKECVVVYDPQGIELSELAVLLSRIGYPPQFQWDQIDGNRASRPSKKLLYQLGLAGFAFGNIMLFSFPEYLGLEDPRFRSYFGYLSLLLAIPVLLYSAQDYWRSVWAAWKERRMSIDIPIVLGMSALFLRSTYEILTQNGSGYLDSLAGFIFFLLIGKWFQNLTYEAISFDRDYKSFFPISVKKWIQGQWQDCMINSLTPGDKVLIRHEELIPCDGILTKGKGRIDYSFVTGESVPVAVIEAEKVYAGGKQMGGAIEVTITKKIDQSKLTRLWNEDIFQSKLPPQEERIIQWIAKHFTLAIVVIAVVTFGYWQWQDPTLSYRAAVAVLIIACPCVIALSIPFLYGNSLRILGKAGIFVKHVFTLLDLSRINHLVFDKTGTLTDRDKLSAHYHGQPLSGLERQLVKTMTGHSTHPLSTAIWDSLNDQELVLTSFEEIPGCGIQGEFDRLRIRIGSAAFILETSESTSETAVFIEIDGQVKGHFLFNNPIRGGVSEALQSLGRIGQLSLLSGDQANPSSLIHTYFPTGSELHFGKSPIQKLKLIKQYQSAGQQVMMIGDGLNDAGALKQSEVGMVLASKNTPFTPASDIIVRDDQFQHIAGLVYYGRFLRKALYGAFAIAVLYNLIGLYFAVQGLLSPVVAAILMPISSLSILSYGLGLSWLGYHRWFAKSDQGHSNY